VTDSARLREVEGRGGQLVRHPPPPLLRTYFGRPPRRARPGAVSIPTVLAFPKPRPARCRLTDAPSDVAEKQLRELHIRLRQKVETQVEVAKH